MPCNGCLRNLLENMFTGAFSSVSRAVDAEPPRRTRAMFYYSSGSYSPSASYAPSGSATVTQSPSPSPSSSFVPSYTASLTPSYSASPIPGGGGASSGSTISVLGLNVEVFFLIMGVLVLALVVALCLCCMFASLSSKLSRLELRLSAQESRGPRAAREEHFSQPLLSPPPQEWNGEAYRR